MCIKLADGNPLIPFTCMGVAIAEEASHIVSSVPAVCEEACGLDGWGLYCKVVTTLTSTVALVFSVAMLVFETVIDFFSDLKACVFGGGSLSKIDPEAILATRTVQIERSRAADAPRRIDPLEFDEDTGDIGVDELIERFDEIFPNPNHDENKARQDLLAYTKFVKDGSQPDQQYNANLQGVVKLLIAELRKSEVPQAKKEAALIEIAEAYRNCPPRTYEESFRQLKILTNRYENLEQMLLFWLQFFKEGVLLERYQGDQFHLLNEARKRVPDWGLDQDPVNLSDPFTTCFGGGLCIGPLNYRYTLNKEFTPARIVEAIHNRVLQDDSHNRLITQYLESQEHDLPEEWQEKFFTEGTINCYGIAWILEKHRFLTR